MMGRSDLVVLGVFSKMDVPLLQGVPKPGWGHLVKNTAWVSERGRGLGAGP